MVLHMNGIFRTDLNTWMFDTSLTAVGNQHAFFRTGMTRKFNNINQWRVIVFFINGAGVNAF